MKLVIEIGERYSKAAQTLYDFEMECRKIWHDEHYPGTEFCKPAIEEFYVFPIEKYIDQCFKDMSRV